MPFGITHGGSGTRLYKIWRDMKTRCLNPTAKRFNHYGARGITICSEWTGDFAVFRDWALVNGYTDTLTIDRIDNNGNYEPNNCQWIPRVANMRKDRGIPVNQFDSHGNLLGAYPSLVEATKRTGVGSCHISLVCRGVGKTAGGFIWQFA